MMTHRLLMIAATLMALSSTAQAADKAGADTRSAIFLSAGEKHIVLTEMRIFLQSVQQIVEGISKDDMEQVVKAAKQSGRNAQAAVPKTLAEKLPAAFKKLGFDTHMKFDTLALDADQLGDRDHALAQLNTLLQNCVGCHAAYRFEQAAP